MAYKDYNGKITIDEDAAQRDISRIMQAEEKLRAAKLAMEQLRNEGDSMKGSLASAVTEKSTQMISRLEQLIGSLEEQTDTIRRTVAKYQRIDREVKAMIQQKG